MITGDKDLEKIFSIVTEIEKSQDEFFRNRVLLDEYRRHILEE
jgi:hypothetical protein